MSQGDWQVYHQTHSQSAVNCVEVLYGSKTHYLWQFSLQQTCVLRFKTSLCRKCIYYVTKSKALLSTYAYVDCVGRVDTSGGLFLLAYRVVTSGEGIAFFGVLTSSAGVLS